MRKITRFILTAVIVLLVPVMLLCFAFLLPPQYDETYLAGLQDKTERLKTVKGQKIILIAFASLPDIRDGGDLKRYRYSLQIGFLPSEIVLRAIVINR